MSRYAARTNEGKNKEPKFKSINETNQNNQMFSQRAGFKSKIMESKFSIVLPTMSSHNF